MNIIGVSAFFHDSACCLLQEGNLVAAVQEERFSRVKHDARLPIKAFRYCLQEGGLDIVDIDCIAYYESPQKKLSRQLSMNLGHSVDPTFSWLDARRPERELREKLGYEGKIMMFDHHQSHAAASFYYSGFKHAAIFIADAVGEWVTTSYAEGDGNSISILDSIRFPDSIGLFYSTLTQYLGFKVLSGEYKVMGLAPYGKPLYTDKLWEVIRLTPEGKFELEDSYFDFSGRGRMFTEKLESLLGIPPRKRESDLATCYHDLACSLQAVLEEVLLSQLKYVRSKTGASDLCMGGGVALNCVANARILRESGFERIFIQPAAGDAGSALGAAALAHVQLTGERHTNEPLNNVYLGPRYSNDDVYEMLFATNVPALDFRGKEEDLIDAVTTSLCEGKVVAWFQGRMEFGPRALGSRSILADPRNPEMRNRLNAMVKKREAFRPFGPSVLDKYASEHLDLVQPSPYMLFTCQVRSDLDLPAITHVNGSCRPQTVTEEINPRFESLLSSFYKRTGCPMLVNTSLNVRGEPIVCSPMDAMRFMVTSGVDLLVIEDFIIDRTQILDILKAGADLMSNTLIPKDLEADLDTPYTFI